MSVSVGTLGATPVATFSWVLPAPTAITGRPAAAQATRVYDDYLRELAKTHPDDLAVLAVSLIGPRNQVAKLVRHLELLR